jgi:purine-binding chemotaxis protein CheW
MNNIELKAHLGEAAASKWATFMLNQEMFALRVEDVQEVLMPQPLTPVPLAAPHIVGLLNLRGQLMSAVDLRMRLNFPPRTADAPTNMLVIKIAGGLLSVVVDDIGDVLELPNTQWRAPPDTLAEQHRRFVFGICPTEQRMVLGLKVAELGGDGEDTH